LPLWNLPLWNLPLWERPLAATCGACRAQGALLHMQGALLLWERPLAATWGACRAQGALPQGIPLLAFLKKNRIPEWVIASLVGQARSDWVHDDVLRNHCQIGIAMNLVLMVATRPHRVDGRRMHPDMARSRRFDSVHHSAQCIVLPQLDQPMCMIRHHNPCERFCVTP